MSEATTPRRDLWTGVARANALLLIVAGVVLFASTLYAATLGELRPALSSTRVVFDLAFTATAIYLGFRLLRTPLLPSLDVRARGVRIRFLFWYLNASAAYLLFALCIHLVLDGSNLRFGPPKGTDFSFFLGALVVLCTTTFAKTDGANPPPSKLARRTMQGAAALTLLPLPAVMVHLVFADDASATSLLYLASMAAALFVGAMGSLVVSLHFFSTHTRESHA